MGPRAQACHSIKGSKGSAAESVAACGKWATAILAHHLWAITGSVGQLQSVSHFMIISQIAKCWLNFNSFLQPGTRPEMAAAIVGTNQLPLPARELCVKGVIGCSDGSRETAESIKREKRGCYGNVAAAILIVCFNRGVNCAVLGDSRAPAPTITRPLIGHPMIDFTFIACPLAASSQVLNYLSVAQAFESIIE